ncbi:UdgX family uracil-DNA binding protein [Gluconobacter albidus]|uniref:Type-4 uracil-DNA glycosylase n=1 Tax=Gluconobacter albidus TaxID=318683 RepID=A0AAW3R0H9_9PROT|nr:UdgX family uracil-DNA binding protein [Gluconobacter albidus]KXV42342.1 DNA polymerase [Gluconobacter albidus]MBS1027816.1 UdgX family uracil-DNA binding protein [Gluconobacter albidus]MCP1273373.1 UdgX family uracil-DNA binding protein [Gluconobacter albidus]GLQ68999.1 uracil-DNA glycosylase [Gluconobacter albidus]
MTRETVTLSTTSDFSGWRAWARKLLHDRVPADSIQWIIKAPPSLYAPSAMRDLPAAPSTTSLPRALAALFPAVFVSEAPDRLHLLYLTLETLRDGMPLPDELTQRLQGLARGSQEKALDLRCQMPDARTPECQIIRTSHTAALIDSQTEALSNLRPTPWIVMAPERTLYWDGRHPHFGPGFTGDDLPSSGLVESARSFATAGSSNAWWNGIAPVRLHPASEDIASSPSLASLRARAIDCRMCELCGPATRTVSGEGNPKARIIFVGEQPGDQEDLQGRPFVGPAGQMFDRALREAGGHRADTWITNAVKHFKFIPRGNRRIHQKPDASDVTACAPWLAAERRVLAPGVTVMLGVTAASAVLGRPVTVSRERSRHIPLEDGSIGLVTVHPSYLLRLPDEESKTREYTKFVTDLRMAISALAG